MIVVFGSLNVDCIARVAHLPREGETLAATGYAVAAGGKGANQALAARRAGGEVKLFGCVGRDAPATEALRLLDEAGVDLRGVRVVDGPTGLALIHVDARGANTITVVAGANAALRAADVPDDALGGHATLLMQLEVPLPEVAALARRARMRGTRVMLNAAPAATLPADLLDDLDVLVVNESEAVALAQAVGTDDVDAWCASRAAGGCVPIVTRGAAGVWYFVGARRHSKPAPAVDVVDTVGAGDAFNGALAAALDRRETLERAIDEALGAGALACTVVGAQPAMPRRAAIERLVERR